MQLKRNLLSVALASATMMLAANAQAQDTPADQATSATTEEDATDLDTVVVTGIRRGIEASIDTKQNEDTIVEAISAEDIGKLPDASIADSIARLPGLTAQRFNGRPQQINIRGFDGGFATTNLNGREQASLNINRGVEFDQYPSELMSQVVVHKTADASLINQGLSGTVNLKTARPLSFPDQVIALNYRADMNKIEDRKAHGNRYSASYIDQFFDNTFGIALGYAHLNNPGQSYGYGSWGYGGDGSLGGSDIFTYEDDNTRDGLMATLEWKPTDDFHSVLDVFYSKFDKEQDKRGVQFGLSTTGINAQSENGTVTDGTANASPVVLRNDFNAAYDKLFSLGWTNELQLNEHWKLTTDVNTSTGTRDETVLETYGASLAPVPLGYTLNSDGYFDFDFNQDFTDIGSFALMDPGGWGSGDGRAQAGYLKDFRIEDSISAVRADLTRSFDSGFISEVQFGANYSERKKSRASDEYTLCVTAACVDNVPGVIPSDLSTVRDLGFAGLDSFLSIDPRGLVNNFFFKLGKNHPDIAKKDWTVRETLGTFYVQANINTDLGSIPVKGNFGVQAVNVDQSSTGFETYAGNPAGDPATDGTSYTNYLPSLNLSFQFPADQFLRFGAGRQMARPPMDDLRLNNDIGFNATRESPSGNQGAWTRTGGNVFLKPWLANAYDLSYEKYFGGNRGYVSAAYFFKDLKTYIYNQEVPFDIRDTPYPPALYPPNALDPIGYFSQPRNGEGGTIKGYELTVSVPFDMLWQPLEGFGFLGSYSDTQSEISPNGPGTSEPLPGLSKYISSATLYYERFGFSTRVSRRTRSKFRGEVIGFGGDPSIINFNNEEVVDFQIGYTFQAGPMQDLSILFQVNNVTDEPARQFNTFEDRPQSFNEYGRTYLLGLNYKF